jgi:flavin reductase (DIM6/NTAB) family NADH-FMN oxidoreductase RutF
MDSPPAPLDARRFRDTMGLFATGVAVIATRAGEEVLAMTANAVSSVSLDPMLVLFCPGKQTRFAQALDTLAGFSINFLRDDQQALSSYFAGGWNGPAAPPFRFVPSPCAVRLEGCLASLDCQPEFVKEMGDHWLVVGRVHGLHQGIPPYRPLVFFNGTYRHIDLADCAPAPDIANPHDEPAHIFYDHGE